MDPCDPVPRSYGHLLVGKSIQQWTGLDWMLTRFLASLPTIVPITVSLINGSVNEACPELAIRKITE